MAKFKDENGEEVEAFTQAEVDAMLKESLKDYAPKKDLDALSDKLSKRSEEYNNLKKKHDEISAAEENRIKEQKDAFAKSKDAAIEGASKGDTKIKDELIKQFDRLNGDGFDSTKIDSIMKEASALASVTLNTQVAPPAPNQGQGEPPTGDNNGKQDFTKTDAGEKLYKSIGQELGFNN